MKPTTKLLLLFVISLSWKSQAQSLKVLVKNTLDFDRSDVTAISRRQLEFWLKKHDKKNLRIKMEGTEAYLPIQWTDYDQDGKYDAVLFQANVPAKSTTAYLIVSDSLKKKSQSQRVAYCKFVPGRGDDLAWENDKVAFRVYGPKGEKEAKRGVSGSTLSSGVDLWFKKVEYSIIDSWYEKNSKEPGYYHTDHGEGHDVYHVGSGRGTGGSGLWVKDSLHVSKNFSSYKILENGPLRVIFELKYARWSRFLIEETKVVTLDMGSNFSRFDIYFTSNTKAPNYSIGISLHDNKGQVKIERENGLFRYWEPIDGSYAGEAIIMEPKLVADAITHVDADPDKSNLLVVTKPRDRLSYYSGFSWLKSGQVRNVDDWDLLVQQQLLNIKNPLELTVVGE